ncbi:twin-arginine translocation signal domain-containing protein [Paraburkholderia sp.]|uniref:carboxylesterase family protein n=1 Tax=Paraburkholderia sp. TaxID=1926495 RepID=UPI00239C01FB|nr:twin-arginine translocation signal domain-containing protein [Paraburkholderia sp.]MDE1179376.1 twin-arginine translocation signal domain-containing protein [Paraburkholderia sp.]
MKMQTRRDFLVMSAAVGALCAVSVPAFARSNRAAPRARKATAVTQVFGDGIRLIAVAVEYDAPVDAATLSANDFTVEGRHVTGVFPGTSVDPASRAATGRFVIVTLSPDDANASLAQHVQMQPQKQPQPKAQPQAGGHGPGKAGDIPVYDTVYRDAKASVVARGAAPLPTTAVSNLIVDAFRQLAFHDPKTGKLLRYNLFVPKDYDASRSYPLVLFMHDAGATSDVTRTTLFQGLGAVAWASPQDQAERPCFVLAPQYAEIITDDDSHTSAMLDTTIDLIEMLARRYSIDRKRMYTTGQSGGCMMSIAMDIKYPDFFAASFLVAGQWDPALVKPLARQKLWILVSQDDDKAWPGENAITAELEKQGAKVSRAVWDGTWTPKEFETAFAKIDADGSPVNYVAFRKGTVIPPGQSAAGAAGHRNTWRIAYTIEPIRAWIFRHHA